MAATVLMVLSASIACALGALHVVYTFWGPKLTPRDDALRPQMERVSPVISSKTTMWRAWVGFNVSHGMGVLLFGLMFGYLALAHGPVLFGSPFLLGVGLTMLGAWVLVARTYWFRSPLIGVSVALACYVASLVALLATSRP